jgi:hypothetical protein
MKTSDSFVWRQIIRISFLATLSAAVFQMNASAQERSENASVPFTRIAVNFAPYLDLGEDETPNPRPPFAGQVVFAARGDDLFVTIADSVQATAQTVSPYWLQVNLESGELHRVERIMESLAEIAGRTTDDRMSLRIAAPGDGSLYAQISINETTAARSPAPPASSRIKLSFFRGSDLIARDESLRTISRDSWRKYLLAPGQARGKDYSRGRCGWLRVGKNWVFIFPADAPGVNTNLYVFPESQPGSPQPTIANADSKQTTGQAPPATMMLAEERAKALSAAKSIFVRSQSGFFTREAMERELLKRPEFKQWGMMITRQEESADLIIEVHRKRFTTRFTFSAFDPQSGRIVASDTASSIGGTIEPKLAARFINMVRAARN